MSELSRDAQAIVDAARDADAPTPADRQRVKAALFAQLGLAAAATGTAAAASSRTSAGAASADIMPTVAGAGKLALMVKVLAGVIVAGGIGLGGYWLMRSEKSEQRTATLDETRPEITAPTPRPTEPVIVAPVATQVDTDQPAADADQSEVTEPEPSEALPPAIKKNPTRHPPREPKAESAEDSDPLAALREEKELISKAKRALDRGEAREALEILAQHATKFENGVLAQDRAGLRVLALCDLGQIDKARKEAGLFLQRWPRASMAQRVRNACQ